MSANDPRLVWVFITGLLLIALGSCVAHEYRYESGAAIRPSPTQHTTQDQGGR